MRLPTLAAVAALAYARRDRDLIITWPTKLTLAPDLGDRVDALVDEHGLTPGAPLGEVPEALPRAPVGQPQWYRSFGEHG